MFFLTSFDAEGNFRWARTWGGYGDSDMGYGVALDNQGFVYVSGMFNSESVDFDPGEGSDIHENNGTGGGYDCFLSKFDINGNFQWAVTWGDQGQDMVWVSTPTHQGR